MKHALLLCSRPDATSRRAAGSNPLDTGARARARPPSTSPGAIGPAPAGGSCREVRFPIPANLAAGNDLLKLRFVRKGGTVPGLVGEVRIIGE